MGTRFIVAKESIVHENYKKRLIKAKDIDSAVTGRSHGHPIRCLRNKMTREYVRLEQEGKSFEELEYLTLGSLRRAVQEGDINEGTVMAGQIAGMITREQSCEEIIREMMEQAEGMMNMMEMMKQMQADTDSSSDGGGTSPFDLMKGMLDPEQQSMFDMYNDIFNHAVNPADSDTQKGEDNDE